MKKFGLFSQASSELINQVNVDSESQAVSFFSKIKNLKKEDLLKIFQIKEIKTNKY